MARGRLISRTLGTSRKFASLQQHAGKLCEFAQALYPMLVSHTDDFGRHAGDAFTVKHAIWPTSPRTEADFDLALDALDASGLIRRYDVEDNQYLQIEQFSEHQTGLHKRTASRFPEPLPGNSRKFREIPSEEKRTELKRTEEKTTSPAKEQPDGPRAFLKWFETEYATRRNGAKYFIRWEKDAAIVKRLLAAYGFERLQKLAKVLLSTNEEWVEGTDRGIGVFSAKINWLEQALAEWEAKRAAQGTEQRAG